MAPAEPPDDFPFKEFPMELSIDEAELAAAHEAAGVRILEELAGREVAEAIVFTNIYARLNPEAATARHSILYIADQLQAEITATGDKDLDYENKRLGAFGHAVAAVATVQISKFGGAADLAAMNEARNLSQAPELTQRAKTELHAYLDELLLPPTEPS